MMGGQNTSYNYGGLLVFLFYVLLVVSQQRRYIDPMLD